MIFINHLNPRPKIVSLDLEQNCATCVAKTDNVRTWVVTIGLIAFLLGDTPTHRMPIDPSLNGFKPKRL